MTSTGELTGARRPRPWPVFGAILGAMVLGCSSGLLRAQMPDTEPTPKMLYSYLLGQAQKHFDARRQVVAALKTPEDVRKRQQELKARFIEALGGFPKRTPLKARVVGKIPCEGYTVERVIYESRPEHHVTANFYLPQGKGPFPGVLVPCGHSANGKAIDAYQRASILLAKNGMAVLCYDPIGQGERIQLLNRQGKPAIPRSTSEHTMVGVGALLVGRCTASYRIWDGIRSIDYLASRPEVDPKRLGCTGNSGGGTMTAYLMALDDRIAAAAPSCYITSLERLFATIGPQDAEQNIPGQVAFGMEHADYVTMRAPKPTLILTGTQDFFDIQGSWTTFREAKLIYGLLGHGERVDLFEYNNKHGFSLPRRQAAMRWMRRWLLHRDDAPTEGDFPILTDAQVQCTRTGQVLEDFKGRSAFDLNAERERELAPVRAKFLASAGREGLLKKVRRLIALPEEITPAGLIRKDATHWIFETERGILVPALVLQPEKKGKKTVLFIGESTETAARQPTVARLLASGHTVIALDLRGMGATSPGKVPARQPNYFGADTREAFLSLHLNRPLLGQRVFDVLAVLGRLAREKDLDGVDLVAVGAAGPVGLHAAALDGHIRSLTLDNAVVSWSAVVRTPLSYDQLTNVVPGVLAFYDLPNLAATLAPRPLSLRAVDPVGKPVAGDQLRQVYAPAFKAYKASRAEKALTVQPGGQQDAGR
jgi:dienelactone hydrolase/pimeloyl-ACP methyl ester carboxylesterase